MRFHSLLAMAALGCPLLAGADAKFASLFDGKSLKGWQICDGKAEYRVESGAIVGRTVDGSPNSFLCTTRDYGDFELEYEAKTDPALNSGVQLRAHKYEQETKTKVLNGGKLIDRTFPAGRVRGYQVEISNEKAGSSGGIFDEARRGWLDDLSQNEAAKKAFRDNEWNKFRVVAMGDSIKVWVNGVPAADIVDSLDLSGFIGLQVHSYKGPKPLEVRWRNLRIKDLGRHEWKPLWDGKSLSGWTPSGGGKWTVEDGAIHGTSVDDDPRIGSLISNFACSDCTVRVRYRITRGNSGFFVRTDKSTMAAYEVEIDAEKRSGGLWETRGRNWVTGPEDNVAQKPVDEWNDLTASVHGRRIVFHLNGVKTVSLPDDVKGRTEGHLALQAHGAKRPTDVWFRDIAVLAPVRAK